MKNSVKSLPMYKYVIPTLESVSEKVGVALILPSRYSIEGMIDWLANKCPQGGLIDDEFTAVFKEQNKGYLSDGMEFLSELHE
jgi:hypothetical protein